MDFRGRYESGLIIFLKKIHPHPFRVEWVGVECFDSTKSTQNLIFGEFSRSLIMNLILLFKKIHPHLLRMKWVGVVSFDDEKQTKSDTRRVVEVTDYESDVIIFFKIHLHPYRVEWEEVEGFDSTKSRQNLAPKGFLRSLIMNLVLIFKKNPPLPIAAGGGRKRDAESRNVKTKVARVTGLPLAQPRQHCI